YFGSYFYHIAESQCMGYAMTDNNRAVDTQNRRTTITLEIEPVKERVGYITCCKDVVDRLCHLKHHITHKPFAYIYVGFIEEQITAFYITYKVETATFF